MGIRWGFVPECGLDESNVRSFSYMEGKRGEEASSVYFWSSYMERAAFRRVRIYGKKMDEFVTD